jgi:hypothetical protein
MIDQSVTEYAGKAAMPVVSFVLRKIQERITSEWVNYRASSFVQGLFWLENGDLSKALTELDHLLNNPEYSKAIFCAYRSACLAKSKRIGPLVIGLIASDSIAVGGPIINDASGVFDLLQDLYDDDIDEMYEFINERLKTKKSEVVENKFRIPWSTQGLESSFIVGSNIPISPMNISECIGRWASKAQVLDLISVETCIRRYDNSSFRENNDPFDELNTTIFADFDLLSLSSFIEKAKLIDAPTGPA